MSPTQTGHLVDAYNLTTRRQHAITTNYSNLIPATVSFHNQDTQDNFIIRTGHFASFGNGRDNNFGTNGRAYCDVGHELDRDFGPVIHTACTTELEWHARHLTDGRPRGPFVAHD